MANKKKISKLLWLLCALMCVAMLLAACETEQPTDPTTQTTEVPEVIYTIKVKTAGGLLLEDVVCYVYDSVEENYIVEFGPLNSDGMITFTAPRSDKYILKMKGVPQGYDVQEYYPLTGMNLDVVLTPSVITEGNATDRVYELGDVITDFTVTDLEGNSYTISEILKTKEAVMLNFWYVGCSPCKQEFPYLQKAYELYSDKIEVLAMNSYLYETAEDVARFKADNGYTFPMVKVDAAWNAAMKVAGYPTTVIIDRYGVVCLRESGTVTEEGIFEGAFNHFTAENYEQKLVGNIEELDTLEYPEGHKRNPMVTYGGIQQFQVNVQAGKAFYCNIMRCDGIIFKVENPNIYVMYENERYKPDENGVIQFELSCASTNDAAKLEFHNESEEDQSITVTLETPPGTVSTPIEMTYGETNVFIKAGNDQGVYYTMTADQAGFIMLAVTGLIGGQQYEIQIDNLNTMQSECFSEKCVADENGNLTVAIPVSAGDELRIVFMSVLDASNMYPETTIQTLVSYSEHGGIGALEEIPYTLTFKDVEGLPMAGITATFTVNGEAVVLVSDEEGVITTVLPEGSYMVQLVFPEGFTAEAAQYLLTPEAPTKDVVVRLYEEKEITYTIHVQDHDGLPVPNAIVTVGNSFMRTDENGNAVFFLPAGSYSATIVPPEGYVSKQDSYSFGVRPEVVIVLENNQSTTKIPYTINILDGYGDPYSNVVVRLHGVDGSTHLLRVTDGVATMTLIRGNYTVDLIFQNENMRYEQTGLLLTEEITSTTIVVAPGVSGRPEKVSPTTMPGSTFDAYYLNADNNFVELEPLNLKFFLFKPTQTGTYKIYTNKPGAEVENWQTLDQTTPLDAGVENNVLIIEVTEVGKTYVVGIDASYDTTNIILTVFRVPDCIENPFPVTPNLPEAPFAPHLPGYAVLKYLDFTGMPPMVMTKIAELVAEGVTDIPAIDITVLEGVYKVENNGTELYILTFDNGKLTVEDKKDGTLTGEYVYAVTEEAFTVTKADGSDCGFAIGKNADGYYTMQPAGKAAVLVLGADGFYHLETEDGPVILIDLMSERFGMSLQKLLAAGEMAWYTYDEDGYPIYKRDFTACMNAYLAIMEPTKGLYPLTEDLYIMIKDYGDHVGWWDPTSENYLFGSLTDAVPITDGAWMFLACYIYIDPALCEHNFSEWTLNSDATALTRTCPYCKLTETHVVGTDCNVNTAGVWTLLPEEGVYLSTCTVCNHEMRHKIMTDCDDSTCEQWVLNADGTAYERLCRVCFSQLQHVVGKDCTDATCGDWTLSADELGYERTCAICAAVHRHNTGVDCADTHFGQWTPAEDGLGYVRSCTICGGTQNHITGTDCKDEHFGQWTLSADGRGYDRICTICSTVQHHTSGVDCSDATCTQWTKSEDGIQYERTCNACGNKQIHVTGTACADHYGEWTMREDGQAATRSCTICGKTETHKVGTHCKSHFGEWVKSEDGQSATRTCTICGHTETHKAGEDCKSHFGEWVKSEDGQSATRTCTICGSTETHKGGTDCEGHYGEWTACEDGVNQQRVCSICGHVQTQPIPQDPVLPPEDPDPVPDPGQER